MPAATELERQLDRYLRHVAIERGLSANTVAAYRRDLTPFLERLADHEVTEVAGLTADAVAGYARTLRSVDGGVPGLAPASVARKLSSIHSRKSSSGTRLPGANLAETQPLLPRP